MLYKLLGLSTIASIVLAIIEVVTHDPQILRLGIIPAIVISVLLAIVLPVELNNLLKSKAREKGK